MKWFFNWLYNGIRDIEAQHREESAFTNSTGVNLIGAKTRGPKAYKMNIGLAKAATEENQIHLNQSSMNFRLYPATGGHIVEYSYYDEKLDRNTQALHLIPSDQDLGDALSKIMTLEALKR
jgi:hypothetical protein